MVDVYCSVEVMMLGLVVVVGYVLLSTNPPLFWSLIEV